MQLHFMEIVFDDTGVVFNHKTRELAGFSEDKFNPSYFVDHIVRHG